MTTPLTWIREAGGWAYPLSSGDVHCRVSRRSTEKWEAIVNQQGGALSASDFKTAEEAKAWCEKRIAERKAGRDD